MKKIYVIFTVLLFILSVPFLSFARGIGEEDAYQGTTRLVVLHTNDTHGHPLKFFHYPMPDVGGMPARATLVQQVRAECENVLVLDAGDLNTGRPESNYYKAIPDIIGLNYIGLDAMTLGNHEFDVLPEVLKMQEQIASFPFLSANVYDLDGNYLVDPYVIKNFNGLRVGIFGLTTKETEVIGNPTNIEGLIFEDEVTAAKKIVTQLEPKVDIIIALVHMGIYDNDEMGSRRLAAQVSGIDLIVDGHSHTKLDEALYVNNTPIVQSWMWGLCMGKGVFTIEDGKITDFSWETIPVNLKKKTKQADGSSTFTYEAEEIPEDENLLKLLTPYAANVETMLAEVIGTATALFPNEEVRLKETALGDLVADSMLWYTENLNPDFAIQNGGGIRNSISPGDISKKAIYETLPFDNSVMVLHLTGSQLQELFDFFPSIKRGKGAFPQFSEGVQVTIDFITGEAKDITINGEPIDPERTYVITTNSYLAAGGDGYRQMKEASYKYDTSAFQRDVFIDYIKYLGGSIMPCIEDRITVIE